MREKNRGLELNKERKKGRAFMMGIGWKEERKRERRERDREKEREREKKRVRER